MEILGYFAITKKTGEEPVLVVGKEETEKYRPVFDEEIISKINGVGGEKIPLSCEGEVDDQGGTSSLEILEQWLSDNGYLVDNGKPKFIAKLSVLKGMYVKDTLRKLSCETLPVRHGSEQKNWDKVVLSVDGDRLLITNTFQDGYREDPPLTSIRRKQNVFYIQRERSDVWQSSDTIRGMLAQDRMRKGHVETTGLPMCYGASMYYSVIKHTFDDYELFVSKGIDGFIDGEPVELFTKRSWGMARKKADITIKDLLLTNFLSGKSEGNLRSHR